MRSHLDQRGGISLREAVAVATAMVLNLQSRRRARLDPWIGRHVFPHALLPSAAHVIRAGEGFFVLEDVHNFGAYYDQTLLAWESNVRRSWGRFEERYGERFYRMWRFIFSVAPARFAPAVWSYFNSSSPKEACSAATILCGE